MLLKFVGKIVVSLLFLLLFLVASVRNDAFAQWVVGEWNESPEYVMPYATYPAYPAYSGGYSFYARRPFCGFFAGVANDVSRVTHFLLCPFCRHYPCSCNVSVVAPCFPSYDICNACGETVSDCGCHDGIAGMEYYKPPMSQAFGAPSVTGFGRVTTIAPQPTFASPTPAQPLTTQPQRSMSGQSPLSTIGGSPFSQTHQSIQPEYTNSPSTTIPHTSLHSDFEGYSTAPPAANSSVPPETDNSFFNRGIPQPAEQPGVPESLPNMVNPSVPELPIENPSNEQPTTIPGTTSHPLNRTTTDANHLPMPVGIPHNNNLQPSRGESTNRANPLRLDLNSGSISLVVPENSQVYINGYETKMQGTKRTYIVNNLDTGKQYNYDIHVVAEVNGQLIEKNRRISLVGGQLNSVAYDWFVPTDESVHIAARPVH
ncbi:MAG: hypothetical protein LBJ67_04890 [Planctomycetaceae bacterium]|jgi:uncharacterized protein (TIGR03000 family)|nr:hypothetical protein [Planctomycetaceae bacterium]